jgi:indole-3-glycerol phosphate synthase
MGGVSTILRRILARKQEEVAERRAGQSLADLESRISEQSPARGFASALQRQVAQGRQALFMY